MNVSNFAATTIAIVAVSLAPIRQTGTCGEAFEGQAASGQAKEKPKRAILSGEGIVQPRGLTLLCLGSDAIIVGKAVRIARAAHTPYNAFEPNQHTVFEVQVIRSLKHSGQTAPTSYFVRQNQGDLAWQSGRSTGVGLRMEGEPMLRVGERYILFLGDPYKNPRVRQRGYGIATVGGVTGRSGEVGELMLAYQGTRAQLLISGGRTSVPQEDGREPFPDWSFRDGTPRTMLGLTEAQAIRIIENRLTDIREGRIG